MDPLFGYQLATICFILFALLGAFDGIYFHMYKYRLFEHPPAKFEHDIHTFRGILFIPITLLFFVYNSVGAMLWLALVLLFIDFVAELIDIVIEKQARQDIGGISPIESAIHVTATGFRMAALAIIIALKPAGAFSLSASMVAAPVLPSFLQTVGILFAGGLFLALIAQSIFQRKQGSTPSSCFALNNINLC